MKIACRVEEIGGGGSVIERAKFVGWVVLGNERLGESVCGSRSVKDSATGGLRRSREWKDWRGGRVAEGNGLLNRHSW